MIMIIKLFRTDAPLVEVAGSILAILLLQCPSRCTAATLLCAGRSQRGTGCLLWWGFLLRRWHGAHDIERLQKMFVRSMWVLLSDSEMRGLKHRLPQRSQTNNENGSRCSVVGRQFLLHWFMTVVTPKLPEPSTLEGKAISRAQTKGRRNQWAWAFQLEGGSEELFPWGKLNR